MIIKLKKFGDLLNSRPDGREAYLAVQPRLAHLSPQDKIIIDFADVITLTPSWADEFVTKLQ